MNSKKILIVKNITHEGPGLLQNAIEEHKHDYEIVDLSRGEAFPNPTAYSSLIVLGGPDSANDISPNMENEIKMVKVAVDEGIPYLGICLGLQVLVKAKDGEVVRSWIREAGFIGPEGVNYYLNLTKMGKNDPIFYGVESPMKIFQLHGESVRLTKDMYLLARGHLGSSEVVKIGRNAYGFQGHLELTESMLEEWIAQDKWLKRFNPDRLRAEYRTIQPKYENNGKTIFRNFLNTL